jgi:hypothetical protein
MRLIFNIEHKSEIMAMSLREVWSRKESEKYMGIPFVLL